MKKEEILKTIKAVKEASKKRNFKQSFDLVINLKFFDPKKNSIENLITLPRNRGKMPNPKSGAIVPPNLAALKPVYEKLQNTVKVATKNEAVVKCCVGMEDSNDEDIADNVTAVYNNIIPMLPQEEASIKSVVLKLTMGKPFKINAGGKD